MEMGTITYIAPNIPVGIITDTAGDVHVFRFSDLPEYKGEYPEELGWEVGCKIGFSPICDLAGPTGRITLFLLTVRKDVFNLQRGITK